MRPTNIKKNADGSWSEARAMGYFADLRPFWKKVLEVPLRLIGVVRSSPLTEIPVEEMVGDTPEPNGQAE